MKVEKYLYEPGAAELDKKCLRCASKFALISKKSGGQMPPANAAPVYCIVMLVNENTMQC